ncbi:MAG TPA: leucine--tRNA ligase [Chlamydiales bacterium]|nr:leucine--tRNA ligase [Chlamydiales bacterium]
MSRKKYDHVQIEKKWQKYWKENKTFKAEIEEDKPKYYVLDMFPYPSGSGLHVGHVTGYTGTDIIARFKRQQGFNVLHPMGWDSFGLPAEQYAIRTGTHPAITTKQNIDTYRNQLQSLGFSYDWDREIATSSPDYYKWTQYLFTKLYEKGLAYEAEMNVNYCPSLGTVLANEEVENGKSKEGGYPVERRPLRQWILKITAYAERLLNDLDELDWPESLKKLQRNWIGKSEGAKLVFIEQVTHEPITVFTTRPDTLFGATYLVLSPEHPLVDKIVTDDQKERVEEYKQITASKSDLERTELSKEKTGVWTGTYAHHPITGEEIPIWISDYVLMGYGTGAIMSVPAHDERDFEFATKFKLPIKAVYIPDEKEIEEEDPKQVIEDVLEGKRCWIGNGKCINSENEELSLNDLDVSTAKEKMTVYLEQSKRGERSINYKLRDWLFSRQRYWGEPIPILHFEDGTRRPLDLDELPLMPPELTDYKPAGTGESPIAKVKNWVEITDPKTGRKALRETNTMPQWAGSCWYYLRFIDPTNDTAPWSDRAEKYWMNVDLYVGGAEHAVLHLLYARFWHKVFYDCKMVSTKEPFKKYQYQGLVTAPSYKKEGGGYVAFEDIYEKEGEFFEKGSDEKLIYQVEKMSKSKLNGITPNDIIEEYGADALRLYEMFMGPFDKEKIWNQDAVSGCKRFLNRFYELFVSEKITDGTSEEAYKLAHRLIDGVAKDIELLQFNTAIAKMMEFINAFTKLPFYPRGVLKLALHALYPFAPHISEELWAMLGNTSSMTFESYPKADPKYLVDDEVVYIIQVNGRLRGRHELPKGKQKDEIIEIALRNPRVKKYLEGDLIKTIFVPDKLLNFVVKK